MTGALLIGGMATAQVQQAPTAFSVEATAKNADVIRVQAQPEPENRAVHFSEDFESGTFPPTGWTVSSGAASTITVPAEQAWHEEANGNPGNCVSVLYNNSVDVHDEWITSPAIAVPNGGGVLRLEFDINTSQFWHVDPNDNADIRCWVSTVSGSITDLLAGTEVFWEQDANIVNDWQTFVWYTYQTDFTAFAGQTVYMGWHYDGQDGAQFNLDNISIYDVPDNDLESRLIYNTDISTDYEVLTYDNVQLRPIGITGVAYNNGGATQANVSFDYTIENSGGTVVDQGSFTNSLATLAPSSLDTLVHQTAYTPPTSDDVYTVTLTVTSDSVDSNNANDEISKTFDVTQDTWGRENGPITSGITNISGGTNLPFFLGNTQIATGTDSYTGAWVGFGPNAAAQAGELAFAALYVFDTNSNSYVYVTQTDDYTIQSGDAGNFVLLPWTGGGAETITAGEDYLIGIGHYGGTNDVEIGTAGAALQGSVLGFDNTNSLFQLIDPNAVTVRLTKMPLGIDDIATNLYVGQNMPNPAANFTVIPMEIGNRC